MGSIQRSPCFHLRDSKQNVAAMTYPIRLHIIRVENVSDFGLLIRQILEVPIDWQNIVQLLLQSRLENLAALPICCLLSFLISF